MAPRSIFLIVVLTIVAIGCKWQNNEKMNATNIQPLKGEINISGAWALEPLMKIWAREFSKLHPDLKITVIANGTGQGLSDLLEGRSQVAMVSRELMPDEEASSLFCISVTREGVIPVVSSAVPDWEILKAKGVTRDQLKIAFSSKETLDWGSFSGTKDKTPIIPVTRSDESGAEVIWSKYLGLGIHELKGDGMTGDTGVLRELARIKSGIGFCNAHYAYDLQTKNQLSNLRVLPIDLNKNGKIDQKEDFYENLDALHHAAYLGSFPSSLCRNLLLVTINKPEDQKVKELFRWILTDGQDIALKYGYCEIRKCDAKESLEKL